MVFSDISAIHTYLVRFSNYIRLSLKFFRQTSSVSETNTLEYENKSQKIMCLGLSKLVVHSIYLNANHDKIVSCLN